MPEYRIDPQSPTRIAMKVYQGPEPDNRWVNLVENRYTTWDEVKNWIPLVPVIGPGANSVVKVVMVEDPAYGPEAEVIRHGCV